MQMVLRGSEYSDAVIELVDNPTGKAPKQFARPELHTYVPRIGGRALVVFAAEAQRSGYVVNKFELMSDRDELPLTEKRERKISEKLVEMLPDGSAAVLAALSHDFIHYLVSGVELLGPDKRLVTLRRDGIVMTQAPDTIAQTLQAFWRKLTS